MVFVVVVCLFLSFVCNTMFLFCFFGFFFGGGGCFFLGGGGGKDEHVIKYNSFFIGVG